MQEEMDRLFQEFGFGRHRLSLPLRETSATAITPETSNYREPLGDIWETDKEVIASVELPGLDKKDIQVNITDDALEIKAERKMEKEEKKKGMYRVERSYSGFYKCMPLPAEVEADKAEATYKNGVLEIHIPKKEAKKSKAKKIAIK